MQYSTYVLCVLVYLLTDHINYYYYLCSDSDGKNKTKQNINKPNMTGDGCSDSGLRSMHSPIFGNIIYGLFFNITNPTDCLGDHLRQVVIAGCGEGCYCIRKSLAEVRWKGYEFPLTHTSTRKQI